MVLTPRRQMRTAAAMMMAMAAAGSTAASRPDDALPAVWPLPQRVDGPCGDPVALSRGFTVTVAPSSVSARLSRAIARLRLPPGRAAQPALDELVVTVREKDDGSVPPKGADESYTIAVAGGRAEAMAATVFGALHAVETFSQMVNASGWLPCSDVTVTDGPEFTHRGLMLDAGRRHFPVGLVKTVVDGMAASKLNVLHLHLSDFGGFRVITPAFPELTAGLVDDAGNRLYWTAEDVQGMVAYASDRGIRVIPEVDLPGHAAAFVPLANATGVQFCTNMSSTPGMLPSQLYDDPEGRTWRVLRAVLEHLLPLFPDSVFHLGADETGRDVKGGLCAKQGDQKKSNAAQIERKLQALVVAAGKQPCAWEEMLTQTEAANKSTIIAAWSGLTAAGATAAGHEALECAGSKFYLDHPKGSCGPFDSCRSWGNLTTYWTDIAPVCSDPATCFPSREGPQFARLLGGEVSLWSDHYCFWDECHATRGGADFPRGCAWFLSGRYANLSSVFAESVTAMLFPRASLAAGSFWRYDASFDLAPGGPLWRRMAGHDRSLRARGVAPCPSFAPGAPCPQGCSEAARCGVPYPSLTSPFPLEEHCPYHY